MSFPYETSVSTDPNNKLSQQTERARAPNYYPRSVSMDRRPLVAPVFPAGAEPLPPGWTEDDRAAVGQQRKMENYMSMAMESCVVKSAMSGGLGTSCTAAYLTH